MISICKGITILGFIGRATKVLAKPLNNAFSKYLLNG